MSEERNGIAISPGFSVGNALLINQAKTIVEKRVISELFCCGGYSFSDANLFSDTFKKLHLKKYLTA